MEQLSDLRAEYEAAEVARQESWRAVRRAAHRYAEHSRALLRARQQLLVATRRWAHATVRYHQALVQEDEGIPCRPSAE